MRRGFRVRAAALALPLLLAAGTASAADGPDLTTSVRLSDEQTYTRWAHPDLTTPIRQLPTSSARQIARLRYQTEDGFAEVYLVLNRWTDPDGHNWLQIRIPKRPNGQTGWVPDAALGPLHLVHTLLTIDRQHKHATLTKSGRTIWRSRIGIGAPNAPTPPGHYWIRERLKVPNPNGPYGPYAFGTSAYSSLSDWPKGGVIGIHGTNQPNLIPGRPSHGCIRTPNNAITRLWQLLPIGTPTHIQ